MVLTEKVHWILILYREGVLPSQTSFKIFSGLGFLHFEYSMPESRCFGIYSAWCSLSFLYPWFGVFHWSLKILDHYSFKYFFYSILPLLFLVFQLCVCLGFEVFQQVLGFDSIFFIFFFHFPLQFGNLLLTYLQTNWFFPQPRPVYRWDHQRCPSFLLRCFLFPESPFDSFSEYPTLITLAICSCMLSYFFH